MAEDTSELTKLLATDLDRFFEKLVLAYQGQLYAFALSHTHSLETAEEIVQTSFIRAYYALKDYPPQRIRILRLEAWLYEITRNVLYNHQRQANTRSSKLPSITLDRAEDEGSFEIEDQSLPPDEEICRRESRQELEQHILSLPVSYQESLRLYYFEDLNYREIAERLHRPVGTIKANVHRGTQLLRHTLGTSRNEMR